MLFQKLKMFKLILSCLIVCVCGTDIEKSCNVQGYYWRDYTGAIPPDALPGGTDVNGNPIYIGQIFNLRFLIPAKIYTTENKAYYEYGGQEHAVTENIKILCTVYPEYFEWIRTNNEEIKLITKNQLVLGGYEPGCTTYIGRARSGGEILVGKALADNQHQFAGLHVTSDGRGNRHTSFEVLSFNPHVNSI